MKRWTCLALALGLLLTLFGCASYSTDPLDTAPGTTREAVTKEPETTAPAEIEQQEDEVPLLLGIEQDEQHVQMNHLTWNLEEGTLSEPTPWFDATDSGILDVSPYHWDGGPTVYLTVDAKPIAEEVQIRNEKTFGVPYGRCVYVTGEEKLYQFGPGDSVQKFLLPRDPGEVYDAEKLPMEPHYAAINGDHGIVAFFVYDDATMEGDVVYCTYPLANPERAVWKSVHIPFEYAVDAYIQYNDAYCNGALYLASYQSILTIDVESGELQVLDATNAFAPVWAMHPDAPQPDGGYGEPIVISGCWKGNLVAEFPVPLPDGGYYYYVVALRDGEPVAILERQENDILTCYDGVGQRLGTTDRYQNKIAPCSIQFPRDD